MKKVSLLLAFVYFAAACSTTRGNLNYSEFKDFNIKVGSVDGENLGTVKGEEGGAIWNDCTEKARGSVVELIAEAKKKGANALGNIKWTAGGSDEPTCKKGWGYALIWPLLLTPLFMSTEVTGTAYKTSGARTGLLMLPSNKAEQDIFVEKVLALSQAH